MTRCKRHLFAASAIVMFGFTAAAEPVHGEEHRVRATFNLGDPTGAPFPSNWFTTTDRSQNTGLKVNLPRPDCAALPSDCEDVDVINTLDGFNLQPRLSIPFDGP